MSPEKVEGRLVDLSGPGVGSSEMHFTWALSRASSKDRTYGAEVLDCSSLSALTSKTFERLASRARTSCSEWVGSPGRSQSIMVATLMTINAPSRT